MPAQQLPEVVVVVLLRADQPADRHEILPNEGGHFLPLEGARVVHLLDPRANVRPAHMGDPQVLRYIGATSSCHIENGSLPRGGQQDVVEGVFRIFLTQLLGVFAHLGEMFGRIPDGLVLDGDDVPVLITLHEDRDINEVQFAFHPDSLRATVRYGLVHLAQEPVQKGPADAVGLAGVEQPGQHVAVADLVFRVAQDVEGIELLPLHILRVVS